MQSSSGEDITLPFSFYAECALNIRSIKEAPCNSRDIIEPTPTPYRSKINDEHKYYVVVYSKSDTSLGQWWAQRGSYDEISKFIQEVYDKNDGYYITDMSYSDGKWLVVMSQNHEWQKQSQQATQNWDSIEAFINEKWDEGYAITNFFYSDGWWNAVMTTNTGLNHQGWYIRTSIDEIEEDIDQLWNDGGRIIIFRR